MALSKQHWGSFQTWRLSKNTPKTHVATGMRNSDSESLWKGREHHKVVLSCFFIPPCSDLNISQICPQGRPWQDRCLTQLCRLLSRQPKAKPGQSALLPVLQLYIKTYIKAIPVPSHWGWMGLTWKLPWHLVSDPSKACQQPWSAVDSKLACQGKCELTLQGSRGKEQWQFSIIHPLTCTVLLSPGGRSRSLTAFCWSQELACSDKHKGFCSTVLSSPAHVCSPETILSASLDVSTLISCDSDGNPTQAEPGIIPRRGFVYSK